MNNRKLIPLTKPFLYINILIWSALNYLLYCFFGNIIILIISLVLYFISIVLLIRNRRYLQEYENNLLVTVSISGYWFWMFGLFTFLLQLKINTYLWFYFIEIITLFFVFIYSKKTNCKTHKKSNNSIDYQKVEKTPKTAAKIVGGIIVLNSIIHISITENQALFIVSIFLFAFTLVSFWIFSSLLIVYLRE